ncbi:MAG: barstar family protein [Lachnospiraceae bacterium]|nr:barstar family protein [Lachnospiraceae bacterium]
MADYRIDLSRVTDVASLHDQLMEVLPLPSWYGRNLDALYDALTELPGKTSICVSGQDRLPGQMRDYYDRLCRVLRDAREEVPGLQVFFSPGTDVSPERDEEEAEDPDFDGFLQEEDPWETTEH